MHKDLFFYFVEFRFVLFESIYLKFNTPELPSTQKYSIGYPQSGNSKLRKELLFAKENFICAKKTYIIAKTIY